MKAPVYMYYRLDDFYQNHRRYELLESYANKGVCRNLNFSSARVALR